MGRHAMLSVISRDIPIISAYICKGFLVALFSGELILGEAYYWNFTLL